MIRRPLIVGSVVAAVFAVGCERAEPTGPSASNVRASMSQSGESCTIDVGETVNPLPALHELEGWLGDAAADEESTVNCGQVRSLDAKMEALTKALDQSPPNFAAACGISGSLVNELTALVEGGQLATPSFPPPVPDGPTNVLAGAKDLNGRWCAAKRGELVGPPGR